MHEWPLLLFTLLLQASVGGFFLLFLIHSRIMPVVGEENTFKISNRAYLMVLLFAIAGIFASLFHLGNPLNAPKAILNLGSSWLSREVFFAGCFLLLAAITYFRGKQKSDFPMAIAILTVVIGFFAVYSMAALYYSTIIAAWSSIYTFIHFLTSTFIFGFLIVSLCIAPGLKQESLPNFLKFTTLAVVAVICFQLMFIPHHFSQLASSGNLNLYSNINTLIFLKWFLTLAGTVLMVFHLTQQKFSTQNSIFYLSGIAVLVGEILGRYLFYATAVPL